MLPRGKKVFLLACASLLLFFSGFLLRGYFVPLRRRSKFGATISVLLRSDSNAHPPCNSGSRGPTVPALPVHAQSPHVEACDLSQGLHFGHRCDVKRGYTFFTFDPAIDEHVSYGMIHNEGLYDSHVHAALDFSMDELGTRHLECKGEGDQNVVLDVGSNLGSLALYSASLGCPTHAFEIQPAVACRLQLSISASSLNVTLHRRAVHSEAGKTFTFSNVPSNPGGVGLTGEAPDGTTEVTVESVRVDDMFADGKGDVLFMKIDTEGNEFEVLKSAERLLSTHRIHYMVVEVRPSQREMVEFVVNHGYSCALIREAVSRTQVRCRGRSLAQVIADVEAIAHDQFSDMFCCVDDTAS